jgi:hypothetical protein
MPEKELELLASGPRASTSAVNKRYEEQLANQIFRDHVGLCAQVICEIATGSDNEKNRLTASKYVVERVLGRTPDAVVEREQDMWQDLFGSITREPTASERQTGAKVSRLQ